MSSSTGMPAYCAQGLAVALPAKDDAVAADLLFVRSGFLLQRSEFRLALADARHSAELAGHTGNHRQQALSLANLGMAQQDSGDYSGALQSLTESLRIERDLQLNDGLVKALNNLGLLYSRMGQTEKAQAAFSEALTLARAQRDSTGAAVTLHNLGSLQKQLGDFTKARESLTESLRLSHESGDVAAEASTLNSLAILDPSGSHTAESRAMLEQALALERKTGNVSAEVATLNNLSMSLAASGHQQEAAEMIKQSLVLAQQTGSPGEEATQLINLALTEIKAGNRKDGVSHALQALQVAAATEDPAVKAYCYTKLADILSGEKGSEDLVFAVALSALASARQSQSLDAQAEAEDLLMEVETRRNHLRMAVLFGVDAVNHLQTERTHLGGLDRDSRLNFAWQASVVYRGLAELLASVDRLREAEQVLTLLKLSEDREGRTTFALPNGSETLNHNTAEMRAKPTVDRVVAAAGERFDLQGQLNRLKSSSRPDSAAITRVQAKIAELTTVVNGLDQLSQSWSKQPIEPGSSTFQSVADLLPSLPPGTLSIFTLLGHVNSLVIVSSATTRHSYLLTATPKQIEDRVAALRKLLETPGSHPSDALESLSSTLIAPIEPEIATAAKASPDGIATILWSLDGALRSVPVNALSYRRGLLLEVARNVVVTPESRTHLADPRLQTPLSVLALGISRSYLGLPALAGVPLELNDIVHDPTTARSHGQLPGQLFQDSAFTLGALEDGLAKSYPIVHIASHFVFKPGDSQSSYLLLSATQPAEGGFGLTLGQMESDPRLSLNGVRLLTLSACSTAATDTASNGREIDSLGMTMQKRGAAAVLATLWSVNDSSTSELMGDFYRRWAEHPERGKAEALRQAQLALLRGDKTAAATTRGVTADQNPTTPVLARYSHPYYWAPFVLIGNFQ